MTVITFVNPIGLFKGKFDYEKPAGLYTQPLGLCELCGCSGVLADLKKQYEIGDPFTFDMSRGNLLPTIHYLETKDGKKYDFLCIGCTDTVYKPSKESKEGNTKEDWT